MKPAALLLLLLAGCASSSDIIDERSFRCGPGQDIEVRAAVLDPAARGEVAGPVVYAVEVANNSHNDVTVKSVRLAPKGSTGRGLQTVFRTFDQVIPHGEDHVFELPATDAWMSSAELSRKVQERRLEFSATVVLSNGDSYHCDFETRW
jgi:hypothetical protein